MFKQFSQNLTIQDIKECYKGSVYLYDTFWVSRLVGYSDSHLLKQCLPTFYSSRSTLK